MLTHGHHEALGRVTRCRVRHEQATDEGVFDDQPIGPAEDGQGMGGDARRQLCQQQSDGKPERNQAHGAATAHHQLPQEPNVGSKLLLSNRRPFIAAMTKGM
jgi:hypothetical protein